MRMIFLGLIILFFNVSIVAGTLEGDTFQNGIAKLYYASVQEKNYTLAQKLLKCCSHAKNCSRNEVMKNALHQAMSDQDAEGTSWLDSELKKQPSFYERHPRLCEVVGVSLFIGIMIFAWKPNYVVETDE